MTVLEQLTREFGNANIATYIIEAMRHQSRVIKRVTPMPRGHTGARLVKALVADAAGKRNPRHCVIKYCPPLSTARQLEGERQSRAWQQAPDSFRRGHLTEKAFEPMPLLDNALVIGQWVAEGQPLADVDHKNLARTCEIISRKLLFEWNDGYDSEYSTVAELLTLELGESFEANGWLRNWAERRQLLSSISLRLPDEEIALPNPWRLLIEDPSRGNAEIDYLVGRTHGDLHGQNILVPVTNGVADADSFRLIDLATYDERAPLSRDLATLLVSLCRHDVATASGATREAFLTYLERDHYDVTLHGGMPSDVRRVIDVLRGSGLAFVKEHGWDPTHWHRQFKVSLLAQAMLHSAYSTDTREMRRWCSRLAGRLSRTLFEREDARWDDPLPFDAGDLRNNALAIISPSSATGLVDRHPQRDDLRAALEDQVTSVVVVSGPPGIGKTVLVREVLAEMGRGDPDDESLKVHWHEVMPYGEIGVTGLIQDIEPAELGQVAGPSARARLEIALDTVDNSDVRPVIVLDSAENLLKDDDVLSDSEFDLALEAVQRRLQPPIKIVFVSQRAPLATVGSTWPETARRISLQGLEPSWLRKHFAQLDPENTFGLAELSETDLRQVHSVTAGNPRLAELLHAVHSSDSPELRAQEIQSWLPSTSSEEVHARLLRIFIDHLPVEQQRIAESLAALGIPARNDAVIGVLAMPMSTERVEAELRALVVNRLVLERGDGRRYLRKGEIDAVLRRLPTDDRSTTDAQPLTQRDLLLRAARVLASIQKDDDDVHGMVDLDAHFARIDVWLRAKLYGTAFDLINSTAALVARWGSGVELLRQREAVRGRLKDDDREGEMINLAALGEIHSYKGNLISARRDYSAALDIAQADQRFIAMSQIYIGMGAMHWEHDDLPAAEQYFQRAFGLAGEYDDQGGDRGAALIGLADCRHRHGDYKGAGEFAWEALKTTAETDADVAAGAAFRLTGWYAELDLMPEAASTLARCSDLVPVVNPAWAEVLTSTANLRLYQGQYEEARRAARQAVDRSREHRDPNTLRRSLTTLALTDVHLNDLPAAHTAIEESARYRVAGRETVELALRSIIAHRYDLPGTARDLFQQLLEEAEERAQADVHDLIAWDFIGIAECYRILTGQTNPSRALNAFRRARPERTQQPPGLNARVRSMVEILANGHPHLQSLLEELARIRPGRNH